MLAATALLVFGVTALFILNLLLTRRPKNYPPGPQGWPFFGNIFQLSRTVPTHKQFSALGKKYGDILGLYFFNRPVVILNNYKDIRKAFADSATSARSGSHPMIEGNLGGNRGLLFSNGRTWQEQRRFAGKTLRDLGAGTKSMERIIMEEVNELIGELKTQIGQPIFTQNRFNIAALNCLWALLAGEKFSHDDPRLLRLVKSLNAIATEQKRIISVLAEFFPIVGKLRDAFAKESKGIAFKNETYKLIQDVINEHKHSLQEDSPRDFIDMYLNECNQTTDAASSFYKEEGYLGLHVVMFDLFLGGAESTSTNLTWTFLILALHPEKQKKLFEEINRVVGTSRSVSLMDRPNLPYLEATLMEVLRFTASLPTGIFHKVVEDFQFQGYTIPEGTMIFANHYSALHDPSVWDKPEEFCPERFITAEGKCIVRNEAFLPFSSGKRVCLGESLARDELFLFMGNLLQQFQVKTPEGENKPTLESTGGMVLVPKPHQVVLLERSSA